MHLGRVHTWASYWPVATFVAWLAACSITPRSGARECGRAPAHERDGRCQAGTAVRRAPAEHRAPRHERLRRHHKRRRTSLTGGTTNTGGTTSTGHHEHRRTMSAGARRAPWDGRHRRHRERWRRDEHRGNHEHRRTSASTSNGRLSPGRLLLFGVRRYRPTREGQLCLQSFDSGRSCGRPNRSQHRKPIREGQPGTSYVYRMLSVPAAQAFCSART